MYPKCDNISRVSELKLRSEEKIEKTWLDAFETKEKRLEQKEDEFEEQKQELRQKAIERGRKQVPKLINKSLDKNFLKLKYDPYDVKAVLHPVDFVTFEGMNKGQVENVTLLSRKTTNPNMNKLHKSISHAISENAYDWKVLRVNQDGSVEYK